MALPYLAEFGWKADVLTVHSAWVEGVIEPALLGTLPADLTVIKTGALPLKITRRVGLGSLALRAMPFFYKEGNLLLRTKKYDLVFFSTTAFPVMALGPLWKKNFGVEYVLDFQDPWLNDYYKINRPSVPPGGRFKYGLSRFLARRLEPFAMRGVSHVISVSPEYPKTFLVRYPWLRNDQFTVLPFGAADNDFQRLEDLKIRNVMFDSSDGRQHWVYVGRGGKDMAFALRCLFTAIHLKRYEEPKKYGNLVLHFIGTDYASGNMARKTVEPIAVECGVGDMVHEHPHRIPYFEALQCLMDADALIVPGSDDPGYTASKIYPYILAKKPLLAVFHEKSSVVNLLRTTKAGTVVTFNKDYSIDRVAAEIIHKWFADFPPARPQTDWQAFEPYSAREMTRRLCEIFDKCVIFNSDGTDNK